MELKMFAHDCQYASIISTTKLLHKLHKCMHAMINTFIRIQSRQFENYPIFSFRGVTEVETLTPLSFAGICSRKLKI